jgi:hypothetical protein
MDQSELPYQVKIENFEGPLDLLLHLIKKNEINIYDIPIALIAQQYLDYLSVMKELNLAVAGEFLVMAATLLHIKSRMLLPMRWRLTRKMAPIRVKNSCGDYSNTSNSRKRLHSWIIKNACGGMCFHASLVRQWN